MLGNFTDGYVKMALFNWASMKDKMHFMHFLNIIEGQGVKDIPTARKLLDKELTEFHTEKQRKYSKENRAKRQQFRNQQQTPPLACPECKRLGREGKMWYRGAQLHDYAPVEYYFECDCGFSKYAGEK